jgi:hypothetical protein
MASDANQQTKPADEDKSLVSFLPRTLRRPVQWLIEITTLIGALGAVIGWFGSFFSFVGKSSAWQWVWAQALSLATNAPQIVRDAVHAVGAGASWLIEHYRAIVHPIFDFLFGWLPFEVPEGAYDLIFIASVAILSLARWWRHSFTEDEDAADHSFITKAGPFAPVNALAILGLLVFIPFILLLSKAMDMVRPQALKFLISLLTILIYAAGLSMCVWIWFVLDWMF